MSGKLFLLCSAFLFVFSAKAQLPNEAFYDITHRDSFLPERFQNEKSFSEANKIGQQLYFDFQSLFFVKNNEYVDRIMLGETFFGYQLLPTLNWRPHKKEDLTLRAGAFLQQNFGGNSFEIAKPVLGLDYGFGKNKIVFGTLYGGLEHRLIEPLYGFEQALTNRYENGIQFLRKSDRLWFDGWVNWMQTADITTQQQEVFSSGISTFYRFVGSKESKFKAEAILQAVNMHRGGAMIEEPVYNQSNFALGADLSYQFNPKTRFFLQPYYLYSLDHSPVLHQPYMDGQALYLNMGMKKGAFTVMGSYWKGQEYFAALGNELFNSFAQFNFYNIERNREMIYLRFIYSKRLIKQNLQMDLRFEPIWDMKNQRLNHSMGIYFMYRMGV